MHSPAAAVGDRRPQRHRRRRARLGLLLAMELVSDKERKTPLPLELLAPARFQAIAAEHGLAVYCRRTSAGVYCDWLMISPPLIISESEIDAMTSLLEQALTAYERELRAHGVLRRT